MQCDCQSGNITYLGVVHNCQHLPISTESTNLGGGRGAEYELAYYFLNVDLCVEHIININASKMYYMVLNTSLHMIMFCTWTSYM